MFGRAAPPAFQRSVSRRTLATGAILLGAATVSLACGGDEVAGPTDAPALTAELEAAFAVFESTALREVGRGVLYDAVLGGRGPDALERNAGTVFRWSLELQRYVAAPEPGPEGGARFILYAALEAVPNGAPLVETGFIDWFPAPGGGLRADLVTERGARIELTATGETPPVPQEQVLTIVGQVIDGESTYEFASDHRIGPDDDGTSDYEFSWSGPDGLEVRFEAFTTRITVFAGEESHQQLRVVSRDGRAELIGDLLGGNGFFDLSIDDTVIGVVEHLAETGTDGFGGIDPAPSTELTPELEAAARQILRTRNYVSVGLSRLVLPVFQ